MLLSPFFEVINFVSTGNKHLQLLFWEHTYGSRERWRKRRGVCHSATPTIVPLNIHQGYQFPTRVQTVFMVDTIFSSELQEIQRVCGYFHLWLWTPGMSMAKNLTDRLRPCWTVSGQPDLGDEALGPSYCSLGRLCAKESLHYRSLSSWFLCPKACVHPHAYSSSKSLPH